MSSWARRRRMIGIQELAIKGSATAVRGEAIGANAETVSRDRAAYRSSHLLRWLSYARKRTVKYFLWPSLRPQVRELKSGDWLLLWRSSGAIFNHCCKSLRSDFHRAGERIIDCHNGQQPSKD